MAVTEKTYHDDLAIVQEELDKCMKCGNCMAVCPVYSADKIESAVTRSKITVAQAVLEGELELDDPAVYEMLFDDDIPVNVAINEAIELAKKYGAENAPSFINGVLAKLTK